MASRIRICATTHSPNPHRTRARWPLADAFTEKPIGPALRHPGGRELAHIRAAFYSPDDSKILTAGEEGIIRVWNASSYELKLELPIHRPVELARFSPAQTGPVGRVEFSPDGHRLLTFGGHVAVWNVIVAPTPVPAWFADLVEAVGGSRLSEDGQVQPASASLIRQLRQRFTQRVDNDFYARWAKWFLVDRTHGPVPPCPGE